MLLFLLGISVGINEKIINNLDSIGIKALWITLGAITGSVLVSWMLYKTMFAPKKVKGIINEEYRFGYNVNKAESSLADVSIEKAAL